MPQKIDTTAVTNAQSLGADDQDERAEGTELKREDARPPALKAPQSINATAQRQRAPSSPDRATWGKAFAETIPLIGAPAFFGPPVIFLLGPWLLLVLLAIGPFALILTILLATAAAACLLAMFVALIASPYLLIRHLRAHGTFRPKPRAPLHLLPKHWVSSSRLGLRQPKGLPSRS